MSLRRWPNASTSAVGHVHEWNIEIVTVPHTVKRNHSRGNGFEIITRECSPCIARLQSCTCARKPNAELFFLGLTAVLLDVRFVPRSFYEIFV